MPVALRTPRLLLREWHDEDVEPFTAMAADPDVMQYLPPLPDRAACEAWIGRMRAHNDEHGFAYRAVEVPGEAALIGATGFTRVRNLPFAPAVEIGWRLARPHWRQGYATEAARAVIEDGFYRLGFEEIVSFAVTSNYRSRAVMERLGMKCDHVDDFDHPRFDNEPDHPLRRHVLYRLHRPG